MLRQLVYRPVVPLAGYNLQGVELRRYLMTRTWLFAGHFRMPTFRNRAHCQCGFDRTVGEDPRDSLHSPGAADHPVVAIAAAAAA